ncbi:hypothetical protein ACFYOG_32750 [Streptomyces sp. NPDC007818]|uniref:hypothetical protein n=1 Tax=Streptomyces sp. NPDC007818 TaxID=3364780 RepID=UPI0036B3E53B
MLRLHLNRRLGGAGARPQHNNVKLHMVSESVVNATQTQEPRPENLRRRVQTTVEAWHRGGMLPGRSGTQLTLGQEAA